MIATMIFSWPPQLGQCSRSISNTRLSSLAQLAALGGDARRSQHLLAGAWAESDAASAGRCQQRPE
jgi:hypothetical protein